MKITNRYHLPQALVDAAELDDYDRGEADYSVTDLITPPRIVRLIREHDANLEDDVSGRLWLLLGKSMHAMLARATADHAAPATSEGYFDDIHERRLFATLDGVRLSGQIDLYTDDTLTDYKVTSAWSRVYGSRMPQYQQQLSLYAWLLRKNGYAPRMAQIVAIYRDWSKRDSERGGKYPQREIEIIPIALWSDAECETWARARIAALRASDLPLCSKDDHWNGRRCEQYCVAKSVCQQYADATRSK